MMDASNLYPKGFHPVEKLFLPDYSTLAWPLSRASHQVRYYFVNYGEASLPPRVETGFSPVDTATEDAQESFKLDVLCLGNVFCQEFYKVCDTLLTIEGTI